MKIIDVEQGTPEWLSWRKTVITATDCPAILGSSPWSTAYKCWQRKLGLIEEQKSSSAMERGKRLEPIARERFIRKYGINMIPTVVECSEYDFLGASLDGISDCRRYILEIKTGNHDLHRSAKQGTIPEYYFHQIQCQLLVTGALKGFYQVSDEKEENDIVIEVVPDLSFFDLFMPKARAFWKSVAFCEPPALVHSDYKDMNDSLGLTKDLDRYEEIDKSIKALEEEKALLRKKVIDQCDDQSCICNGVKIMKSVVRGRVAYDEIPEIKGIDLDKYRKGSTTTWKILVS
jgi:putative phage-type endonuclease